jgi:diguanylate cyclase (GGDEF)-like protein
MPLALILLLGLSSMAGLLAYFSNAFYQHALDTLSERVRIALRHESVVIAELAMDYSYWDVAYQKLIANPDPLWADDNIGIYLHQYVHVDLSLAADANGNVTFAFRNGEPRALALPELMESGLAQILQAEQAAGMPGNGESGLIEFDDTVYLAGVNSFTTEYENDTQDGSFLVLGKALDQAFLERIADQYQIPGLRTVPGDTALSQFSLPVLHADNRRETVLAWDDPGNTRLFDGTLLWLLAIIAVAMCLLALWVVLAELSRQRQHRAALSRLALQDWLTDADNRRGFFEKAQQELLRSSSRGAASTLLLLDLDEFKSVNDRFGHACGDATLIQVTRCLRRELRTYDLLARVGGEEFAVLLPQTALDVAQQVADRLLMAAASAHTSTAGDREVAPVTVSIGIAHSHPQESLDALMERADKALYAAKRAGRNRWVLADEPRKDKTTPLAAPDFAEAAGRAGKSGSASGG